jgi:oligopeptide/dipeptide ABC transporter ATP-binding protein
MNTSNSSTPLLRIEDLHLEFKTSLGRLRALNGINLEIHSGETFGLAGETGCGKTVTGLSVLRLLPRSATISSGRIYFKGKDLLGLSHREIEKIRGARIAMIFQDPSCSLNPVFNIGSQIERVVQEHMHIPRREIHDHTVEMLTAVGLPDAERILQTYPHQLSGGMQQRVMIAMALSCRPSLLIADEPTTALDVTIQAQILRLLHELQKKFDVSVILITHNLGVVAHTCNRLAILYGGRVVEIVTTKDIFNYPRHPYTRGLLDAIPRSGSRGHKMKAIPGNVPVNPGAMVGCAFSPRCEFTMQRCRLENPPLFNVNQEHRCSCFLVDEGLI